MAKQKEVKPVRGVFERPKGSNIWWINYYVNGKQRREKAGTRSAAIELYRARKADAWRGIKLPELRNGKVTVSALIDDALQYARTHNKSARDYECKAKIVREAWGGHFAADLKPQEIDAWLGRFKTNATANRYKAFISLIYREGVRNGRVQNNPARQVPQRKEGSGRLRYLSRDEYSALHDIIRKRFPEHLAEFVLSVHTGVRLGEQYSVAWGQVHFERCAIDLTKTKNGDARTVHLNSVAIEALQSIKPAHPKSSDLVFPRRGTKGNFNTRSWFVPCMEEAKIAGYVWHSNRHTFCSWLAMAGASIKEIQEAAGHKTITMSARYSHLSPQHRLSVVERLVQSPS
jgi:integrase